MKKLIILLCVFVSCLCNAQKINLSNKEDLISYLNKKEFTVGDYGKIVFKYDEYDKAFNALKFKVEFTLTSEKKSKKIQLETMIYENDGFYVPEYVKYITLRTPGAYVNDKYKLPTTFSLFENGELYYLDKPNISMEEYIKAINNGDFVKTPKSFLCK